MDALDEERAVVEVERAVGAEVGEKSRSAEFWRKNETPSAVISGAIRGALRSGRYANRSIDDAEHAGADHRGDEHERQQQVDREHRARRAAADDEHAVADERADHVDLAVREVQQLEDPVDHRVAERDQRVDAPERQPVDELLNEEVPGPHRRMECGPPERAALPLLS